MIWEKDEKGDKNWIGWMIWEKDEKGEEWNRWKRDKSGRFLKLEVKSVGLLEFAFSYSPEWNVFNSTIRELSWSVILMGFSTISGPILGTLDNMSKILRARLETNIFLSWKE